MGRNKKTLLIASIVIFHFSFFIFHLPKAFAQTPCQPIYGGGETCVATGDITVNSKILNPSTNKLVDNLGANEAKYKPGFIVTFQVLITNNRNAVIDKLILQDIFPQFVSFSSGPGSFDGSTRTLTFETDNLMPSETKTFNIFGRILEENQLSFPENVLCLANQVIASVPDPAVGQDNSQFCIEKKSAPTETIKGEYQTILPKGGFPVLSPVPVSVSPSTGPESLVLFSLIPAGILGWFLRKI